SDSIRTRASRSAAGNDEGATARGLVEAFVDGLRAGHAQPFEHDELLVTRVERIISEPISAERLYARLKRSGEEALGTYSLYSDVLDGLNVDFFALDRQIPAVFTQDGWDGFVENRIETESEDPNRDDWVIASRDVSPESETSSNEVHNRMTNLYMEEYGATWHAFLTGIEYQALRDVDAAARRLISLGDPDRSPILYILAKATYNTFGSGSLMDQATEQLDGDGSSNPVKRRFKALHELNAPGAATGTADASLIQALSVLGRLGETLESIKTDGSRIAELAADVIDQRGGELATAREEIRSSLSTLHPSIRDQLFDRPIVLAWQAILNSSQDYLNQRWQDEVYDEFRSKLAGRFPVDQASITDDVPIDDFERFFRPAQGTISSFYAEVLEPFLRDDMRTSRTWLNQGIAISAVTSDALNGADRIGEALFEGEALRLTFELTPELPNYANANAPRASQYNIDVHGQMSTYTMGRPISSTIQWPGSPDARLRVSTQQGELDPIQYSGHWAWFKLIRAADRTRVNSTQYEFRWDVGRGVVARYNVSTRQAANPFADTRSFFEIRVPSRLD
ncbi:MAG: hypothetical protein KJO98_03445, partial [Rhodothermia bacterium]|nr:hypothetical protein [Rhodothermia bacterium]